MSTTPVVEEIVEAQVQHVLDPVEPIDVHVETWSRPSYWRTSVNVGDTTWSVSPRPARDALDERGLPGAQVAGKGDDVAGAQRVRARAPSVRVSSTELVASRPGAHGAQKSPSCSSGGSGGASAGSRGSSRSRT